MARCSERWIPKQRRCGQSVLPAPRSRERRRRARLRAPGALSPLARCWTDLSEFLGTAVMFKWLNKQSVESDRGFVVQFTGRFSMEYREGSKTVTLAVEGGFSGG